MFLQYYVLCGPQTPIKTPLRHHYANASLCVNFWFLCMTLARVKVKIKVTCTGAAVKSKVLAPLHRHDK